jgi:hypothetical protein
VSYIIQSILENGFSLIVGLYDCDIVTKDNSEEFNQIRPYFSKEKLSLLTMLLSNKQYIKQIMISNNINFKVQLKKYGGFGYSNLFKSYKDKIIKNSNLEENEVKLIFSQNLLDLLEWWEVPKKQEKRVVMIKCSKYNILLI